ncbi:MAG: hypothetical protein KatS3mg022_3646 [Armatimonadota bacterium]|nr:MAG: hypothetical protein KatS3mg022_3646 [Armatimonadota bacterium]
MKYWATLLALAVCTVAAAQTTTRMVGLVEKIGDKGKIDWQYGVIYAKGIGAIPDNEPNKAKAYLKARRYAIMTALENLLMVTDKVRVDATAYAEDFEAKSERIRTEVRGFVKGAEVVHEQKVNLNGAPAVEVTVAVRMYGEQGLSQIIMPEVAAQSSEPSAPLPVVTKPVAQPAPAAPQVVSNTYTSVIIDTRGLGIRPAMSPKIRRQDGSEVWGTVNASQEFVIEQGIVVYAKTLEEAKANRRAGSNPLILRAIGYAKTPGRCDPVLSDNDVRLLLTANEASGFLNEYRVIFVID